MEGNMAKSIVNKRFLKAIKIILNDKKELKKGDLSENLGIIPSAFSDLLKEKRNVSLEILLNICSLYRVNPNYLLLGRPPIFQDIPYSKDEILKNEKEALKEDDIKFYRDTIKNQQDTMKLLQAQIARLEEKIAAIENSYGGGGK